MNQLHNYGKSVKALLTAGIQSTKCGIPLGTMFDDGMRRYRWAYIKVSSTVPGVCLVGTGVESTTSTMLLSGGKGVFNSAKAGWGGSVGDINIKVYGVSGLTGTTIYEDGTFEVKSGVGKGFSYPINSYEIGKAGTTVIRLAEPLVKALSTNTYVTLRPNKYWGLALPAKAASGASPFVRGGATTISVTASGYGLVITRGPGMGFAVAALSAGRMVAPMNVSGQLSTTVLSATKDGVIPWGTSLGAAAGADQYFAIDWTIE